MYLELAYEEWAFFSVDFNKLSFGVDLGDVGKVHVHDLASLEVSMEEMKHYKRGLSNNREEFFLGDLSILTVAL